ncbi:Armadillo-like helical [Penicillium concentricum]|uniref:Sister chromatid cohesion protein n=1 Tax=Penicillium concentricum TaxID=293559 RepID=A0A9W9SCU6_9EURO|nr:Armadillo-like helical [Penicillium concentricum]KAJ5375224.1 Armadillo-like helical [Penicillium concentricum]
MDQNGRPAVQVVINGHDQMPPYASNMQFQQRPLSVDEALQYSSMSSAPIFGLDCILRPDVGRPSNTTSINHVLQEGRKTLGELDMEMQSGRDESSRLETSREYIQQLLDGDQLTEFKFKLPQVPTRSQQLRPNDPDGTTSGSNSLGSFARMMLTSTDIAFRYPEAPSKTKPEKKDLTPTTAASFNQRAFLTNRSQSTSFSASFEQNRPPSSQLSVVIPVKPVPQHSDHANAKKQQLKAHGQDAMAAVRLKDQKEEADAALQKLQDLLHEVFEAEDQIEPDTSTPPTSDTPNPIFVNPTSLEVHGLILSSDAHTRLQKALRKVAGFDRLQDIPSDYLNRIQKLCEKPIIAAKSLDISLGDSSSEVESQEWLGKIEDVLNALFAIGTLLQTMSGRQTERELCPEDLIEAIPTVLNHLFDHCIIPAVESRPGGKDSQHFQFFSAQKRIIGTLVHQSKKVLTLFADFLSRIDVSEGTITAAEFFAAKLIFVENAHNDKDSALGYQKYEPARRGAMDVLAKVFSKYPEQRPFILDEILVSLEKLPTTRQNARQFKVADGKNIQLLTALVLQLVQTTALETPSRSKTKRRIKSQADDDDDELMGNGEDHANGESDDDESDESLERLANKANRLYDNAMRSAQYIVNFIVQRAMNSTKTGDQPYRNILDLFTQDLINVLGSADWPAAELLLRILALRMIQITDQDKSAATAKSMALELLGWMGSAISDLIATAQHMLPALEDSDSELTDYLKQQFEEFSSGALHHQDLITPTGPYRIALEHLLQDKNSDNWQLTSARGYYLAQWAKTACALYYNPEDQEVIAHDEVTDDLVTLLTRSFSDPRWLETHKEFDKIPNVHGKFAYILTVLNSNFGKAFDTILKVLLASFLGDSAKVRSRSLKSVIYMLEKDPNLLDRDPSVLRVIHRCTTDASPMVRDSALQLIGQCIGLKPKLEEEGCRSILACAADQTAGVRKRCIGLLKELYHKTSRKELKLAILDSFLQRTGDLEESVASLARQTFEEIWLVPFHESIDSSSEGPKLKMALGEQVGLIVGLTERSETALESLSVCLKAVLSDKSKSAALNFKVCKAMVSTMFQRLVEDSDGSSKDFQQALLQTITVFAKSNAKLFTPDQLEALHPYIGHLSTADDLFIFRSVVVIYRCVLPFLSSSHNTLLKEVQNDLFKSVAKLARSELNEVMACLWTINSVLQNTNRLVKLTVSVLKPLQQYKSVDLSSATHAAILARAKSYIRIAGCVGRHCDLEKYASHFKSEFPTWAGGSVAGLMVDSIIPFTASNSPFDLRVMALESLGSICQSWPGQFGRERTRQTFAQAFKEDAPSLQNIVLRSFADFFAIHEGKSEKAVMPTAEAASQEDTTRLGGSLRASDNDGAAALIAQNFLSNMLQVAQSRQDTYSLTAIELIASINRQGLVHPKECAGVLVSLETSTVPAIAKIAFDTHKMLHQQYESMFEREYMRAVQEAFYYQRDIVGDSNGANPRPYVSKLAPLFEIVKISNSRYQKKFLANLCSKINFELKKLDVTGNPPEHLLLARFISQNLAHFDYGQLAEVVPTIACMERIVSSTGTIIAHAIETDISPTPIGPPQLDASNGMMPGFAPEMPQSTITPRQANPATLRLLATAAASLSMLWEARTHLRRLYGVNAHSKNKEGKPATKELNKTATKVHGVTGDKFWEAIARNMTALDSEESMLQKCREFATLLSIDEEFRVDGDEDAEGDSLDAAGDIDETVAPRPMKRKSSVSSSNLSKRPKGRKSSTGRKKSSVEPDEDLDWD